ncbi:MAG: TlpA family protein disulfide reductase [Acidobacteria bacterium]|nr:MAG: TlpA family protein disulfide reductase [Acidobacteriota bacterium]
MFALIAIYFIGSCGISNGPSTLNPSSREQDGVEQGERERGTQIGQMAPDFELEKVGGGKVSLSDLRGKPAVLVFWTAWCPSCKEEAKHVNKLATEFEPKGVNIVGINIGEGDARISQGIKEFGIRYTVLKDKDTSVARRYKVIGTPTVVFLDRRGIVRYFGNELPKNYAEILDEALKN